MRTDRNLPAEGQVSLGRVFVGGPFFGVIDPITGRISDEYQQRLEQLFAFFEELGAHVDNAHRREAWGAETLDQDTCTRLDYDEISAADVFVAFPGDPPSPGTHIEFGWASAMGKPIVVLAEEGPRYASLLTGLGVVAPVRYLYFGPAHGEFGTSKFWAELERAVAEVLGVDSLARPARIAGR